MREGEWYAEHSCCCLYLYPMSLCRVYYPCVTSARNFTFLMETHTHLQSDMRTTEPTAPGQPPTEIDGGSGSGTGAAMHCTADEPCGSVRYVRSFQQEIL